MYHLNILGDPKYRDQLPLDTCRQICHVRYVVNVTFKNVNFFLVLQEFLYKFMNTINYSYLFLLWGFG